MATCSDTKNKMARTGKEEIFKLLPRDHRVKENPNQRERTQGTQTGIQDSHWTKTREITEEHSF